MIYVFLSVFSVLGWKKLYDDCFHEWKIIPLHLLNKYLGPSFKFDSNLHFESKLLKDFPSFYKQILMNWKKYFIASPITPSCVLSQFLWYNSYIKIDNNPRNISTSDQSCFNVVDQRWNNVDPTLKMKQNPTSDFQRCTMLIQRQYPTLKQRWYNVDTTLF